MQYTIAFALSVGCTMSCLELDDEAILKVAEPMMDDVLAGLVQRDYVLHSKHFSVNLKALITPESFLAGCDQHESDWGRPGARTRITLFRKRKSFTVVWHLVFSDTPDEVMAVVTVALKGGRYFVDNFLLH